MLIEPIQFRLVSSTYYKKTICHHQNDWLGCLSPQKWILVFLDLKYKTPKVQVHYSNNKRQPTLNIVTNIAFNYSTNTKGQGNISEVVVQKNWKSCFLLSSENSAFHFSPDFSSPLLSFFLQFVNCQTGSQVTRRTRAGATAVVALMSSVASIIKALCLRHHSLCFQIERLLCA